jgi:DNA polymerase
MVARTALTISAADFLPAGKLTLRKMRAASKGCRGCHLYKHATQTVFGEGDRAAKFFFVGEQPGDHEDIQGKPFVGPAGRILDKALEEAGIDRRSVYVTNAVKHFKWQPRGKRRIHQKPNAQEIRACRPWLEAELEVVQPRLIVALGATAAQSLMGAAFRVTKSRGRTIADTPFGRAFLATVHPSSILRAPDDETRRREFRQFVSDLAIAARG